VLPMVPDYSVTHVPGLYPVGLTNAELADSIRSRPRRDRD
jgi:hypothetical protein